MHWWWLSQIKSRQKNWCNRQVYYTKQRTSFFSFFLHMLRPTNNFRLDLDHNNDGNSARRWEKHAPSSLGRNNKSLFIGLPLLKQGKKQEQHETASTHGLLYATHRLISPQTGHRTPLRSFLLTPLLSLSIAERLACIMGIRAGETPQGTGSFTHTHLPVYQGTHLSLSQADRLYCVIMHNRKGLHSKSTSHML